LLTAARLCSRLELHSRVGEVLSPLSQLLCSATAAGANRKAGLISPTFYEQLLRSKLFCQKITSK